MKSPCCRVNSVEARQSKHAWALFAISGMHVRCRVRQKCRRFRYTNARLRWLSWKRMGGGGGDPFTQGRILHMNRAKIRVCLTFCTGWLNSLIPHQLKLKTTISFSSIMDDLNCDSTFVCLFVCLFALCYFFFFCKPPDNRHPRFNSAMIIITCRRFHDYQVDEI